MGDCVTCLVHTTMHSVLLVPPFRIFSWDILNVSSCYSGLWFEGMSEQDDTVSKPALRHDMVAVDTLTGKVGMV